jgi:hypothetical protein
MFILLQIKVNIGQHQAFTSAKYCLFVRFDKMQGRTSKHIC